MKTITINVKSILENETVNQGLEKLQIDHKGFTANETSIHEAYEGYLDIKSLLLESIDKGIFEELAFQRRTAINNSLNSIKQYYNNVNQFIAQYNTLDDQIKLTNLTRRVHEDLDIILELKEITRLRRKYKKIVDDLTDSETIKENLKSLKLESEKLVDDVENIVKNGSEFENLINRTKQEIETTKKSVDNSEQEIENRKKAVIAFTSIIESSEETLISIETELNNKINDSINNKISQANSLLRQAEEALELKQTEGISMAYSSRLAKLTSGNTKSYWLIASIIFVLITLFIGFLLTGGSISFRSFEMAFSANDNVAFIIGRIVVTGIGISGAVFCANRYVHLKNLEEDYEYKVVLSKSILAFSNKIKELDQEKLAEYLTKVLHDLHQDPLRERKSNNKNPNLFSISQFNEMFNNWKQPN